jgi:hypothetical protein
MTNKTLLIGGGIAAVAVIYFMSKKGAAPSSAAPAPAGNPPTMAAAAPAGIAGQVSSWANALGQIGTAGATIYDNVSSATDTTGADDSSQYGA